MRSCQRSAGKFQGRGDSCAARASRWRWPGPTPGCTRAAAAARSGTARNAGRRPCAATSFFSARKPTEAPRRIFWLPQLARSSSTISLVPSSAKTKRASSRLPSTRTFSQRPMMASALWLKQPDRVGLEAGQIPAVGLDDLAHAVDGLVGHHVVVGIGSGLAWRRGRRGRSSGGPLSRLLGLVPAIGRVVALGLARPAPCRFLLSDCPSGARQIRRRIRPDLRD